MEIIYLDHQKLNIHEPICSAIGFFDGLHLGHMQLVDKVIEISKEKGMKKALMTFDHHPLYVLGRITKEHYLTSMRDRIQLLEDKGIDYLFIIQFTKEVATLSPQDFIDKYLIQLSIQHVVCGFDFHFGFQNLGDAKTLKNYDQHHLNVTVIDEVIYDGEKISSTRIRKVIELGHMGLAKKLLGRRYMIRGKVIAGRRLGRNFGFPTANIDYSNYFLPKRGVYAVEVIVGQQSYLGMCNVGYNPTVGTLNRKSVEVNIFDFDEDIYGQEIRILFIKKIRDEKQFSNQNELIKQLRCDKESIQKQFH